MWYISNKSDSATISMTSRQRPSCVTLYYTTQFTFFNSHTTPHNSYEYLLKAGILLFNVLLQCE